MNLSEALDAALPEIPKVRLARSHPPRIDPDLVAREDSLDGEPFFSVLQRERGNYFRLLPIHWQLAQFFDGVRSYDEIADLFSAQIGSPIAADDVRMFADSMEESDFWYKTPQERNLALSQKLTDQRGRRAARKSKLNLLHFTFSAWDPDRYLEWLDDAIGRYIYSPWMVLAVVLLFLFEGTVFIAHWNVIGPDITLYYNFTQKSGMDLAQFWLLFLVLGFIHESAHGLTCKHFGGQVHAMGLLFMYLMPAFYCDVTEVWVSCTKVQRLATIIAGIWIELTVCGLAMIAWASTPQGDWLHDFTYQIILITGVAVVMINLNPLIKLDGYYFLTELIGIPDLKERTTGFLSGWFQSRILRLRIDTPVVPRKRVLFFMAYALASGAYSYMLLFFVIRFSFNVTSKWLAEWALIPAGALAFVLFRSRLRSLRGVALRFWEQHFDSGRSWRPTHFIVAGVLAVLLFSPLWRDRESAYYVIEPVHSETLHAAVAGRVNEVLVHEGETVRSGQALLRMSSAVASSMHSAAVAQTMSSQFQAVTAELGGQSVGTAAAEQSASARSMGFASEAESSLVITAPADGIVLTQNPPALLDQDVASGQPLLDLADPGPRIVRIYIPTSELERIAPGAEVALRLPDRFSIVRLSLAPPGGESVTLPPGLIASQNYKGIKLPVFYSARMLLPAAAGNPLFGTSGEAKIFGERRSIAGRFATIVLNLVKAHIW